MRPRRESRITRSDGVENQRHERTQVGSAKSTGIDSSRRTRARHYLVAGVLKGRDDLCSPHGRKLLQEHVETVASFEIVNQ
jgi:hypothetical protein